MGVRRLSSDFYLSLVLNSPPVQKILRSSSDFSRIRVKRTDPDTHKAKEFQMDERLFWEGKAPLADDLWLRAGDIIEVPDKP
jgi:hypothetical protein